MKLQLRQQQHDRRNPAQKKSDHNNITTSSSISPNSENTIIPPNNLCSSNNNTKKDNHFRNRMKICALAICLMWSTALKVAVSIASIAITTPPLPLVFKSCKNAFLIAWDEKQRYAKCVDVQLESCQFDFQHHFQMEETRRFSLANRNNQIVSSAQSHYTQCSMDYANLRLALEGWVSNNKDKPLPLNNSCTEEEQNVIKSTVGDTNFARGQVSSISEAYSIHSQSTIHRIADYAQERKSYDVEYLANHTQALQLMIDKNFIPRLTGLEGIDLNYLDLQFRELELQVDILLSCVSMEDTGICKVVTSARERYDDAVQKYQERYDNFRDYLDEYVKKANNLKETYDGITKAIRSVMILGVPPAINNWLGRESIPDFDFGSLPTMTLDGVSLSKIWPDLKPAITDFHRHLHIMRKDVQQHLKAQFDSLPLFLPEDYNPPNYVGSSQDIKNLDEEEHFFRRSSETFMQDSNAALDNFDKMKQNFSFEELNVDIRKVNVSGLQSQLSDFDLSFESLTNPDFDFNLLFIQFESIGDLLFLLDFIFRIYFSARICFKYWDVSNVKLPQIDVRTEKERTNPFKMSKGRLLFLFITNPIVGFLVLVFVGYYVTATFLSIYTPLYQDYVNGCVSFHGNGSFTTKNLYSISYNLAYQEGSTTLIDGLESFDTESMQTCSQNYGISVSEQNEANEKLYLYTKSLNSTEKYMQFFDKCMDLDQIDDSFQDACCGLDGYGGCINIDTNETDTNETKLICPMNERSVPVKPYLSPRSYIRRQSCIVTPDVDEWILDDALFDCSRLPTCSISCNGPQKEKMSTVSKECGCMVEYFLHSVWLQLILSILIFILLNTSRIIFMNGLARICWDKLTPGTFSVWATCDAKGSFLYEPHDGMFAAMIRQKASPSSNNDVGITHDDQMLKTRIKKQIDRNSFIFRLVGCVMMVAGLSINLVWIVLLFFASRSTSKPAWI